MQMTLSKNSTFCRVNSKDEPNSIDVLAKAISLSGINGLDLSSYGQAVLAEAIASSGILCMNPHECPVCHTRVILLFPCVTY